MLLSAGLVLAVLASPSPAPTATPRFEIHGYGAHVFLDQATNGPGQAPPEGTAYRNGAPTAPMTPYDYFSDDPVVPGVAGELEYLGTATWHAKTVSYDLGFELTGISGDLTNAIYWAEPFVGKFDPHEGRSTLTYLPYYPTHAGGNDVSLAGAALPYTVAARANDGSWRVQGGYVSTSLYDRFVFAPPPVLNETPQLGVQTLESLGPGSPSLARWSAAPSTLPSLGGDAELSERDLSVEATDALLPQYPGTSARLLGAAVALDRGTFGRFSADVINVDTSGNALVVPSIFGVGALLHPGPQGNLATSSVAGQRETIAGVRAMFYPMHGSDLTVEAGRAWYDASLVAEPGSAAPGNYLHAAWVQHLSPAADAGVDLYRVDPRYGTILLAYGAFENLWGIAWAYPGAWLKSLYPIVDNSASGTNRLAARVHADYNAGRFTAKATYMTSRQIDPSTAGNLSQTGFIEVEFLALAPGPQPIGHIDSLGLYGSWNAPRDTVSLDYVRDAIHRDEDGNVLDFVDTHQPQAVLQEQHRFSDRAIAVAGYGWFSDIGTWTSTPVHDAYHLSYLGGQIDTGARTQLLVQFRRYGLGGTPSVVNGPLPTFAGTMILVDERVNF